MDPRDILAALEEELRFYRNRLFGVFACALLIEGLLVVARVCIPSSSLTLTNAAYTFAYVVIVLVMFRFHDSYVSRIYRLRWERSDLCKTEQRPEGPFPLPFGGHFRPGTTRNWRARLISANPSMQLAYLVAALAVVGIVLVWSVPGRSW